MKCWDLKSYELIKIIKSLIIYLSRVLPKIEYSTSFLSTEKASYSTENATLNLIFFGLFCCVRVLDVSSCHVEELWSCWYTL
mgnify:CR=1 FL=1